MNLGAFSVSLAVKDLQASRLFYETLGFTMFGGDESEKWLIMKNDDHAIGLFEGMFDENILTFNPGWDGNASEVADYTDVRDIQKRLLQEGVRLIAEVDDHTTGPGHIILTDPDGNQIMIDQHV
jgi:lactoylglutathione lyase